MKEGIVLGIIMVVGVILGLLYLSFLADIFDETPTDEYREELELLNACQIGCNYLMNMFVGNDTLSLEEYNKIKDCLDNCWDEYVLEEEK